MTRRLLLSVPLFATLTAHALTVSGPPSGYLQRVYRIVDGLPEGTVQAFAQTPDRFLWIGTTGGLVRFDGTHFTVFDRDNTPVFKENSVFCLMTDNDGSLWIGMEGSGLIHLKDGIFQSFDKKDGLTDTFVRAIAQDSAHNIWVGTNHGLFRISAATPAPAQAQPSIARPRIERIDGTPAIPPLAVNSIREDRNGRLWFGGSILASLNGNTLRRYALPGDAVRNRVKSIYETNGGVLWVGTVSGMYRLLPGEESFKAVPQIHGTARVIRQTSSGELWVSIVGQGASAYQIDPAQRLVNSTPLSSDTVLAVFEDAEQNVWLGTETGMTRFTPTPMSVIPLPNAKDSDFGTIYRDRENTLWAGSTHLFRLRSGSPEPYALPGLQGIKIRNVLEDRDGSLWFGTEGGGLIHRTQTRVLRYTYREGLANNFIRALLQARDSSLWIGTDEGVSHLEPTAGNAPQVRFTNYGMSDGLAYQSIRALLEDHNGDLWIGTEQGLSHLHQGHFISDVATSTLRQDKVWALHEDAAGTLWAGTRNNGLYRLGSGRLTHYSTADGLASHSIYSILEDEAGHFWMSGPTGVSLLDRHELDRIAQSPTGSATQHLSLTFYGIAGETEPTQIFGGMQSAGALSPGGDVWFPSNRGPIHISSALAPKLTLPPVIITRIVADGREIPASDGLVLPAGNSRLEINFAAVMMRPQDAVRFKYKLEGLEKDWNDAGTRHVADYTNVPAGHYTFRLAAFEMSDPARMSESRLSLRKSQHFYRTWWFLSACLLAIAAAILAVYRVRIEQIRRRFQAVIEERNRLAREMHDTLLQGCASVSAVLEAVSSLDSNQVTLKHSLIESARSQIRSTINEAREAVWELRHEREAPQDLSIMMCSMGKQLSRELGIVIDCDIRGQQFDVDRPIAHELMMITREAVYNAANHAAPTIVRLSVDFRSDALAVGVADDGCGFDSAPVPADSLHFGLIGMQERVARLGGKFSIKSRTNVGTEIAISVPRKAISAREQEFYAL